MNALAKLIDQARLRLEETESDKVAADPWRLLYHLMPPVGWLNDPNGLCYFNGSYHVFFQYVPFSADGAGLKIWGHYQSKDLINWTYKGAPVLPDTAWDCHGVYSGSSFVGENPGQAPSADHSQTCHIFYTGNVKEPGRHDYINSGRGSATITLVFEPGGKFGEKQLLLSNEDYPVDYSCHIRDPKVWQQEQNYYMVLGARTKSGHGGVLQYRSRDLIHWKLDQKIGPKEKFGYMWECPDIFNLDDSGRTTYILSFSPQGLERGRESFQNVYQSGYLIMTRDQVYQTGGDQVRQVQLDQVKFREWDYGFDFYAPQTFQDQSGRRILIAWAGLPDIQEEYQNPTVARGWQHCLSLPRVLTFRQGQVYQEPVEELQKLRQEGQILRSEKKETPMAYQLHTRSYELYLPNVKEPEGCLRLGQDLEFRWKPGLCLLEFLNETGAGRKVRYCPLNGLTSLRLMADNSILEFYLNEGERVMTTRYYPVEKDHSIYCTGGQTLQLWTLAKPSVNK